MMTEMKPTQPSLRERCDIALACLPQAEYRERLAALFDDLLAPQAVMLTADEMDAIADELDATSAREFGNGIQRAFAAKNGIELKEPTK